MATTSSWVSWLGQQTVTHHATADTDRLALMNVTSSSQYRSLLARIYGFESAVESSASAVAGLSAAAVGARLRVGRLHHDLLAVGLNEVDIAMLPVATVEIRGTTEGLGWLFVLERQVLLAGLIRRFLASELRVGFATARTYLDTHVDGGGRLREFSSAVSDSVTRGDARVDAVLGAARAAFEAQHQWYARTSARRRPAQLPTRPRNAA